ncbi:MAG: DUF5647 family protein [Anaerolineae bacterium]
MSVSEDFPRKLIYEARIGERWHAIVRYDTAHGRPHKDILHPDSSQDKVEFSGYSQEEVLTLGERYITEHPEVLEQIPQGAEVVLLPQDDPELYRINLGAARRARSEGNAHPVIYVEIEALVPPRSRLVNPRLTHQPSLRPSIA